MGVERAREAARAEELILVDIRTPAEWRESGIPDVAVPLDMTRRDFVRELLALRERNPRARLGLICATGHVGPWDVAGVAGMHTRNGWLARELPVRAP